MWRVANILNRSLFVKLLDTLRKRWLLSGLLLVALTLVALCAYLLASSPSVRHLIKQNPQTTAYIEDRKSKGELPKAFPPLHKSWIALGRIPDLLQKTVLVAEDGGFFQHSGLDWHEIKQAINKNIQKGRVVRGASTITQQLAKNLFLSNERTVLRKIREWLLAAKLENHLSKNRILELYLNCIEYGPTTFGLQAASQHYFNKAPEHLHLSEMIRLAAIIPKPRSLDPRKPSKELAKRSFMILDRLLNYRYIDAATHQRMVHSFEGFFHPDLSPAEKLEHHQPNPSSSVQPEPIPNPGDAPDEPFNQPQSPTPEPSEQAPPDPQSIPEPAPDSEPNHNPEHAPEIETQTNPSADPDPKPEDPHSCSNPADTTTKSLPLGPRVGFILG